MENNNIDNGEIVIDLKELFFHIKKYWYIVIVSMLIGVLGAAVYIWQIEVPKYQASAMIYMRDAKTQISVSDLQMNAALSSDYEVILKSRPVINRVISDLNLDVSYEDLYNSTTISTLNDTRIIKISVVNDDAELSAKIANQLVNRGVDTIEEIENKQPYTVEKAVVNINKINMSNSKVLVIGLLLGCMVSVGALFIEFYFNDKLRSADDIEKTLGVPVLAGIGECKELAQAKGKKRHEIRKSGNQRTSRR